MLHCTADIYLFIYLFLFLRYGTKKVIRNLEQNVTLLQSPPKYCCFSLWLVRMAVSLKKMIIIIKKKKLYLCLFVGREKTVYIRFWIWHVKISLEKKKKDIEEKKSCTIRLSSRKMCIYHRILNYTCWKFSFKTKS